MATACCPMGAALWSTSIHSQARPETFIPIIGGFIGGADAQSQSFSFVFGPNGMLRSGSNSQSRTGVGMGLGEH
jgi:hypothetical protein